MLRRADGLPSLFDDERYQAGATWSKLPGAMMRRDFVVHELFPYLQDRPGIVGRVFREVRARDRGPRAR
ncbi:MAG: hypothetical protein KatS3mg014_1092 [Actinomycetota bacterium]|nr:MAG: hypothetical protein KatS3mg014_1092 [Actinomycetota bacterium]